MSLQDTQLPGLVMAGLYKKNLVITEHPTTRQMPPLPPDPITAAPTEAKLNFLGSNDKKITILVNYPDQVFMPDDQLSFLTAVLQACKLNLADISIVNVHQAPLQYDAIKKVLDFKTLLLFGVKAETLGIEPIAHFVSRQEAGFSVMESPALEQLNKPSDEAKLLKSKLWLILKQMLLT